jgi:hypothetical protein
VAVAVGGERPPPRPRMCSLQTSSRRKESRRATSWSTSGFRSSNIYIAKLKPTGTILQRRDRLRIFQRGLR